MSTTKLKVWMDAERPVWTAAIVLAVLFNLWKNSLLNGSIDGESLSISGRVSFVIETAIFSAYVVVLVRYLRGPIKGPSFKPPFLERRLGVWGYVWRSLILIWLSAIPMAFTVHLFRGDSAALSTAVPIASILAPALICWLLFGNERGHLLKKTISYFR